MDCPACHEHLSDWRVLNPRFGGGWRCRKCGVLFYLDQDDLKRRSRRPLLASIGLLVFAAVACYALGYHLAYALWVFMFVFGPWYVVLMLRTRVVLERNARDRRVALFLGLGTLTGLIFFLGGMVLIKAVDERYQETLVKFLAPFLFLSIIFFAIGYYEHFRARKK